MAKRNRKTRFGESLLRNQHSYLFYRTVLTELCLSQFEWVGLPDSVDPRFLELKLFENGSAVYFQDDVMGDLAMAVMPRGALGYNGVPLERTAWSGYNGYSKDLDDTDSVIIFNNMVHTNSVLTCEIFARRLWDYDRIIDVNVNAQKTPILILAAENEKLTLQNVYKEYDGNAPVIFGSDNFNMNAIKAISTGAPYVGDKIYSLKTQIWNEALTFLGISNLTVTKREQVNRDEVYRAMGGTYGCRYSRLVPREQACERINRMFGLNVSVRVREESQEMYVDDPDEGLGSDDDGSAAGGDV